MVFCWKSFARLPVLVWSLRLPQPSYKTTNKGFTMTEWHPLRSSAPSGTSTWESYNKIAEDLARKVPAATMPSLDHLSRKDYDLVYEPSDDTYLLLDGIQYEFASATGTNSSDNNKNITSVGDGGDNNSSRRQQQPQEQQQHDEIQHPPRIRQALEIGCGSGVPIVYLGSLLQKVQQQQQQHHHYDRVVPPINESEKDVSTTTFAAAADVQDVETTLWATDINPHALQVARWTALENGLLAPPIMQLRAIQCDLASELLPQCQGCMDVILFNPPYVPTPDEEVQGHGIEASWAGGRHGRRVVDRAIPQISQLLSRPHGVCYMITVDDNDPEELAEQFHNLGLAMRPLVRRRACNEYLTVQKLTWST
jgi:methylase of polypeptide subunit release factors